MDPFGSVAPTNLSQNVNTSKIIKESCNTDVSNAQQQQHDSTQESIDGGNHSHHIHQIVRYPFIVFEMIEQ